MSCLISEKSGESSAAKRDRDEDGVAGPILTPGPCTIITKKSKKSGGDAPMDATAKIYAASLLPAPYFYYRNHSTDVDEDPQAPLTPAGHIPCFPAKMHAILASPELNDVVAWDDHGRSFRVLNPKRFESYILPKFFDHSLNTSFIRQANGWGFRRFLSGPNRFSYYHEYFLRSMPWLCKKMRRARVGEKKSIGPEHEPDLGRISKEFPVPNNPMTREIQVVLVTIKQGPKTQMPKHWGTEKMPVFPDAQQAAITAVVDEVKEEEKEEPKVKVPRAEVAGVEIPVEVPRVEVPVEVPRAVTLSSNMVGNEGGANTTTEAPQVQRPVQTPVAGAANLSALENFYLQGLQQSYPSSLGRSSDDEFSAGFRAATRIHIESMRRYGASQDFNAGFRAATEMHNNHMRDMLTGGFVHDTPVSMASAGAFAQTGLGIPMNMNPASHMSADRMCLLQMRMAAQGAPANRGRSALEQMSQGRSALEQMSQGRSALEQMSQGRSALEQMSQGHSALEQIRAYQAGGYPSGGFLPTRPNYPGGL